MVETCSRECRRRRRSALVVAACAVGLVLVSATVAAGDAARRDPAPSWTAIAEMVARARTAVLDRLDAQERPEPTGDAAATRVRRRVRDRFESAERRLRRAEGEPSREQALAAAAQLESIEATFLNPTDPTEASDPSEAFEPDLASADAVAADVAGPGGTVDTLLSTAEVADMTSPAVENQAALAVQPSTPVSQTTQPDPRTQDQPRQAPSTAARAPASSKTPTPVEPAPAPTVPVTAAPPTTAPPPVPLPGTVRSVEAPLAAPVAARVPRPVAGILVGAVVAALVAVAALRLRSQRRHLAEVLR